MLKGLLSGRATGAPLFLAWIAGLIVFVGLTQMLKWTGFFRYFGNIFGVWLIYTACSLFYATWQAALLVSSPRRRIGWLAVALLASCISMVGLMDVFEPIAAAALLQGILLSGERRRAWLWFAVAAVTLAVLYAVPFERAFALYSAFGGLLNKFVHGKLIIEYPLLLLAVVMSLLGAVAAFCMPPIKKSAQEQDTVE